MKQSRALALLIAVTAGFAAADEGIWLFNAFPKRQVEAKYGFAVTDQLLDHLRKSSVKMPGASASFVSPNGLMFTNHHVASECIQRLSTAEHDYMRNGFYATGLEEEKKCPDFDANVPASRATTAAGSTT